MSVKNEDILNGLTEAIRSIGTSKTSPFDSVATLKYVDENNVAWVHFEGGVEETPVRMTVNAKPGDQVQVRVSNGDAFLIGNVTAPPTDDTKALEAEEIASTAKEMADRAKKSIDEIKKASTNATYPIDIYAPSSSVDGQLYSALVEKGWDSDVIVDDSFIDIKKLFINVLETL